MKTDLYHIKNKLPELEYAFTLNGVELPVLDVTHPLFNSAIDEVKLGELIRKSEKTAEKTLEAYKKVLNAK